MSPPARAGVDERRYDRDAYRRPRRRRRARRRAGGRRPLSDQAVQSAGAAAACRSPRRARLGLPPSRAMSRRAWLAFAAISLIWGIPYLLIRIAVRHGVTPPVLAWARVALAAVLLLSLAWRAGTLRSLRGKWRWLLAYAVAEVSIPFPMIAAGEEHVSSSLAAIVIASVPLIGALLALRFDPSERPTPVRAVGLLIGFGGVVALVGIDVAG